VKGVYKHMKIKKLNWRNFLQHGYMTKEEYRADIKVKGIFGIRFQYGKRFHNNSYYYFYIINGKKFGDYNGFDCNSLEDGKRLCEEKHIEICNQIFNTICV